ncbi:hypothetical protein NPIL_498541, partial [Nephila pilipes]
MDLDAGSRRRCLLPNGAWDGTIDCWDTSDEEIT